MVLRFTLISLNLLFMQGTTTSFSYIGYSTLSVGPLQSHDDARLIEMLKDEADWSRRALVLQDTFYNGRNVDLVVSHDYLPYVLETLADAGLGYSVKGFDLQRDIDEVSRLNDVVRKKAYVKRSNRDNQKVPVYPDFYQRYDEIVTWLEEAEEDSDIASLLDLGITFENRTILALEINAGSDLPHVWVDGGTHAREWITHATVIWIIYEILFGSSAEAEDMRNNYRWTIVPVVNPDGYDYTWTQDRLWRKNRQVLDDSECVGIDVNRNFDVNFGACGVGDSPCTDDWAGNEPFTALESQAVRDALLEEAADTVLLFSFHSYGQLWLVPWASQDDKPTDFSTLQSVAIDAASAAASVDGKNFIVGTPPDVLNCAAGTTFDWAKNGNPDEIPGSGAGIKFSYAPELRPSSQEEGGVLIPPENIEPSGAEVFAGVVATLNECCSKK